MDKMKNKKIDANKLDELLNKSAAHDQIKEELESIKEELAKSYEANSSLYEQIDEFKGKYEKLKELLVDQLSGAQEEEPAEDIDLDAELEEPAEEELAEEEPAEEEPAEEENKEE